MGEITDRFASAFRDYVTDGVPSSGAHEPVKSEIRAIGQVIETALSSVGASIQRYETKALMDAETGEADGQLAYVWGDGTAENNAIYQSEGGAWTVADWYVSAVSGAFQDLIDASTADVIRDGDLTLEFSPNMATAENRVDGRYVTNQGAITSAAGWVSFRVPVTPGVEYTFGNFSINTAGYSAFYPETGETFGDLLQYNGSHSTGSLPKTVLAPANAAWLWVTVARPANVAADWAETMINEGDALLDYVDPRPAVTEINGNRLLGSEGGGDLSEYAKLGEDANFGNLDVASLTTAALYANLPSGATRPGTVDVNEAWIDTSAGGTDGTIKVRLS